MFPVINCCLVFPAMLSQKLYKLSVIWTAAVITKKLVMKHAKVSLAYTHGY